MALSALEIFFIIYFSVPAVVSVCLLEKFLLPAQGFARKHPHRSFFSSTLFAAFKLLSKGLH